MKTCTCSAIALPPREDGTCLICGGRKVEPKK